MGFFGRHRLLSLGSEAGENRANSLTDNRLPMLRQGTWPSGARTNFVAGLGEFVGTFLFLFFSFAGTQIANTPPPMPPAGGGPPPPDASKLMFIALAFGLSLMVNVWAFYRVTGGLFNPAVCAPLTPSVKLCCVTLALYLIRGLSVGRALVVAVAQFLGGIAAAAVVSGLFPGPPAFATTLGGGASIAQGLFIEMFLTTQLVYVIIMLAAEKHKSTYLAPIGIGIAFFLAELIGVYFTGGSLNPARSLGPAIVNHNFPGYFWIYWLGPLLGSLLACGFYFLLQYLKFRDVNPGQDR
ncbi:aquaporin-like protein [Parathielavia appendiculata]|uniref:Aquaporin-like protein n=1 Tax=Parathielavia appendiculata TaxID=2587402 RepID=A0AAN6TQ84_9PEZI|nr:aquaporin-like protein [Parathielavia appendiculata]